MTNEIRKYQKSHRRYRNFFKSPKVSHFCHSLRLLSWAEINSTFLGQPLVSSIGKTSKVSLFLSFQFTNTFLLETICILRVVPKKVWHHCSLSFLPFDMFGFWFLPISCFSKFWTFFPTWLVFYYHGCEIGCGDCCWFEIITEKIEV